MPLSWLQRKTQSAVGKAASTPPPAQQAQATETEQQAHSLVKQLSNEILQALVPAQAQIQQLRSLSPTLTERMLPLFESIEKIHAIAKSAQAFSDGATHASEPETLNAADFFNGVLSNRSTWFRERNIKIRHAIGSAHTYAKPSDFYTFADELLLWCADFSKDIALQVEAVATAGSETPRTRVRISAAFDGIQQANQPSWQNTRWFVWHRLAKRLQAKTELRTEVDRLVLRISFPPVQASQIKAPPFVPVVGPQPVNERLKGLKVLVISAHQERCLAVKHTLQPHGVLCEAKPSVRHAHDVLQGSTIDAVIYDDDLPYEELLQIRRAPAIQDATAFLELHPAGMQRDFQPSTSGAFTTGHVAVDAIERSLASALSFEVFKTM